MKDSSTPLNIGFIGLGMMGCGMARHVLAKGHSVGLLVRSKDGAALSVHATQLKQTKRFCQREWSSASKVFGQKSLAATAARVDPDKERVVAECTFLTSSQTMPSIAA